MTAPQTDLRLTDLVPAQPGMRELATAVRDLRRTDVVPLERPRPSDALASLFEAELRLGLESADTDRAYEAAAALWRRSGDAGRCHATIARVLAEIGSAWSTGHCDVLVEHRVSATAAAVVARLRALAPPRGGVRVLLAAPPGERHTLALHSLAHLVELAGHRADVVGDLPVGDLLTAARSAGAVVLSVHTRTHVLPSLLRQLRDAAPAALLAVGGPAAPRSCDADLVTSDPALLVHALARPGSALSPRERQVLRCVADGLTNTEAAEALGVAPATFKTHLDRVFEKTGTTRRAAAVAVGLRRGWIE